MALPKKYYHDHMVLLLLSINAFLALAGSIFILLKLATSHGNSYFLWFRPSLGVDSYKSGGVADSLSFIAFAALVLVTHVMLSLRAYRIHRQLAITILSLGILLLVLTIIVSNALLVLR